MSTRIIMRQGRARSKPLALGVSGVFFFKPPRGGLDFAIQFRCYPMRNLLPFLLLLLTACSTPPKAFAPPQGTEGGWKLAATEALTPPEWMPKLGVKQALRLSYSGPIDATADVFEMASGTAAFECMQKWRATPGEDRFYRGSLFVVVRSTHPNREMMMDFSRALQKAL